MQIDPTRTYRTRDGRSVTNLRRNEYHATCRLYPWRAEVDGTTSLFTIDGKYDVNDFESAYDLFEAATVEHYDDWQIESYENQPKEKPVDKPDFTKPETLKRRDDGEFRILATDIPGNRPIAVVYRNMVDGYWFGDLIGENGRYSSCKESAFDLIPKPPEPPRVTGWLNVYDRNGPNLVANEVYTNQDTAKGWAGSDCIGQVYVDAEVQQ